MLAAALAVEKDYNLAHDDDDEWKRLMYPEVWSNSVLGIILYSVYLTSIDDRDNLGTALVQGVGPDDP